MYSPPCSDVCTHRYFTAKRLTIGPSRPATTAATMTRMETRNGPSEPPSSATQRWCGLSSGSCRPDVATARRAGWRRPQETATVRGRAGPLLSALVRLQKTRRRRLGVCSLHSLVAVAAPRRLASADTHETGSFQPKRSNLPSYEPCATEELAKRTSSAAADSKAAASNFAPLVLRRSIAMRVLALAICGYVAALQPARNAPRQSLAVRQAPRGVRERTVHFISLQRNAIAATQDSTYDAGRRRLRRVRHVVLHDDREAGLLRFIG